MPDTPIRDCELKMNEHTKEPKWERFNFIGRDGGLRLVRVCVGEGGVGHKEYRRVATFENQDDAARAVACVNALRNVENPEQFVKDAVTLANYYHLLDTSLNFTQIGKAQFEAEPAASRILTATKEQGK